MARTKHPGFKGAVKQVEEKEGLSEKSAERIIGKNKAEASEAARKKNPHLNYTAHGEHAKLASEHSHPPHGSK